MGLLALASGVIGQDDMNPCSAADVLDVEYEGIIEREWIESVAQSLDIAAQEDNMNDWLAAADDMREALSRVEAACRGLVFNSEGKGLKSLVGPIELADGLWKASLRTDGMITTATITNVEGSCYEIVPNLFLVSEATLDVAQEALMKTSGGCIAMIEIENVGGTAWHLSFEPISVN